jgi:uncharacterized protein YdeI (YjbR/CyaY-like superfamily)
MSAKKSFKGTLERLRGNLGWTIVRLPFDATKVWSKRNRFRVKGTINGFAFRTSLFGLSDGGGQMLLVNKQMQKEGHVALGSTAEFVLEPDLEERVPSIPAELASLLKQHRDLRKFYEQLNPSAKSDIGNWVSAPKSPESRTRRAEQLAERMMLVMEGERELPPILQLAFRRVPQAKAGWVAMTPNQRRGHLMGIFYYRSPDAREKRATKAVEEALKVATRGTERVD